MRYLILIFLFTACEKDKFEQELRSVQPHLYCITNHTLMPPHEYIMSNLIPERANANYQYDSVYVTCYPRRNENEVPSVYSVKGNFILIYHFFSPKKVIGGTLWVMYDPQGDSIHKYMGQMYYGD